MEAVGETLRRERLKRNLDIDEISRELKISARFLRAIEDDQYEKLPGGVFARSFVRQYARMLGLDEEQIAGQMQQATLPVPEFSQLPDKAKSGGPAPIQLPKVDEWQTVGDRRFHWSGWLSALGLVAVMLVCSAVYTWMQRPKLASFPSRFARVSQYARGQPPVGPASAGARSAAAQPPASRNPQAVSQPPNAADPAPPQPVPAYPARRSPHRTKPIRRMPSPCPP